MTYDCRYCDDRRTVICGSCAGSGEGAREFLRCRRCQGLGEVPCDECAEDDDHYTAPDEDFDPRGRTDDTPTT